MSNATTAWRVASPPNNTAPVRMQPGSIDLEAHLEDWIEADSDLLAPRLTILGRQLETVAGPIDLLALDDAGALVVVELKRGAAYREAIAQALDYAAAVARWSSSQVAANVDAYLASRVASGQGTFGAWAELLREKVGIEADSWISGQVRILVAGTGTDAGAERVVDFLSGRFGVPVNAIAFDVYASGADLILVRQAVLSDSEARDRSRQIARGGDHDELMARAEDNGTKGFAQMILDAWNVRGRASRPESAWWSVKRPYPNGRHIIARVYPVGEETDGVLYIEIAWSKLAEDCGRAEDDLRAGFGDVAGGLGGDTIRVTTVETARKVSEVIRSLYEPSGNADEPPQAS